MPLHTLTTRMQASTSLPASYHHSATRSRRPCRHFAHCLHRRPVHDSCFVRKRECCSDRRPGRSRCPRHCILPQCLTQTRCWHSRSHPTHARSTHSRRDSEQRLMCVQSDCSTAADTGRAGMTTSLQHKLADSEMHTKLRRSAAGACVLTFIELFSACCSLV